MPEHKGITLVFTGNGKGKTTAAVGMGIRATGHGRRVLMIQFMKGPGNLYGETVALRSFPSFEVVQSGRDRFIDKEHPDPADVEKARRGMDLARKALLSGDYDLLILDEINVAVNYGLVPLEEVLDLMDRRPPEMDIMLTGRYAHDVILERADLVSEIREAKHHYKAGVSAQAGIEF